MSAPPNKPKATAARAVAGFALALAGVGWFSWQQAGRRTELETVTYPTALADGEFLPAELAKAGVVFEAVVDQQKAPSRYEIVSGKGRKLSPERMFKVGSDVGQRFFIYREYRKTRTGDALYVLLTDGVFLEIKAAAAAVAADAAADAAAAAAAAASSKR